MKQHRIKASIPRQSVENAFAPVVYGHLQKILDPLLTKWKNDMGNLSPDEPGSTGAGLEIAIADVQEIIFKIKERTGQYEKGN